MSDYFYKRTNISDETFIAELDGKFYPYQWDGNQVKWNGWFCNGHSAESVRYVSRGYTTKASALRAIPASLK